MKRLFLITLITLGLSGCVIPDYYVTDTSYSYAPYRDNYAYSYYGYQYPRRTTVVHHHHHDKPKPKPKPKPTYKPSRRYDKPKPPVCKIKRCKNP